MRKNTIKILIVGIIVFMGLYLSGWLGTKFTFYEHSGYDFKCGESYDGVINTEVMIPNLSLSNSGYKVQLVLRDKDGNGTSHKYYLPSQMLSWVEREDGTIKWYYTVKNIEQYELKPNQTYDAYMIVYKCAPYGCPTMESIFYGPWKASCFRINYNFPTPAIHLNIPTHNEVIEGQKINISGYVYNLYEYKNIKSFYTYISLVKNHKVIAYKKMFVRNNSHSAFSFSYTVDGKEPIYNSANNWRYITIMATNRKPKLYYKPESDVRYSTNIFFDIKPSNYMYSTKAHFNVTNTLYDPSLNTIKVYGILSNVGNETGMIDCRIYSSSGKIIKEVMEGNFYPGEVKKSLFNPFISYSTKYAGKNVILSCGHFGKDSKYIEDQKQIIVVNECQTNDECKSLYNSSYVCQEHKCIMLENETKGSNSITRIVTIITIIGISGILVKSLL